VAMYTKYKPISVTHDIGLEMHDLEGRVITMEFEKFIIVNVYIPNSGEKLGRLNYRTEYWDYEFLEYIKRLNLK
jgi:exodeoxyribonuclease III